MDTESKNELLKSYADLLADLQDAFFKLDSLIELTQKVESSDETEVLLIYRREYEAWLSYIAKKVVKMGEELCDGRSE